MKKGIGCIVLAGLGALVLIAGLYVAGAYNGLVTRNEQVDSAWAQVDNQLQRAYTKLGISGRRQLAEWFGA